MAAIIYRHPVAGFRLPLPPDWERVEDARPGVALIAVEPDHGGGFRANVVVTAERLPPGLDLDAWQDGADGLLRDALADYVLIDRERLDLDGRDVVRRLAHHAHEDTGPITMEQWAMVGGGLGYTLTASVATPEYDAAADAFAGIAWGFRLAGPAGDGDTPTEP
ncbi:MAG TPA: hypothetical protein VF069_00685 [Streptosporangiaceae bacterium]